MTSEILETFNKMVMYTLLLSPLELLQSYNCKKQFRNNYDRIICLNQLMWNYNCNSIIIARHTTVSKIERKKKAKSINNHL